MTGEVRDALSRLRRILKEATGEAKWDDYLEHCRRHHHEPVSRGEFERRRADEKEGSVTARCC